MTIPHSIAERLDPVYASWLEASNPPRPEGFQPTLEQMRQGFAQQAEISNQDLDSSVKTLESKIEARDGHAITVRLYQPANQKPNASCCVYIHGGGWVLGNLDTHHGICVDIALKTGHSVISVDYRLSPEHIFPAALHDTVDVLNFINQHPDIYGIDATKIYIMGDSAGGSLAVSACLELKDSDAMPTKMALIYPALGADIDRPSFVEHRNTPGLSPQLMQFFFISYIGGETLPGPLAAPLTVSDLSALPPIFISAAEMDPLRDDATDFAKRLQQAGKEVQVRIESGLGHGYLWVRHHSEPAASAFTATLAFLSSDKH